MELFRRGTHMVVRLRLVICVQLFVPISSLFADSPPLSSSVLVDSVLRYHHDFEIVEDARACNERKVCAACHRIFSKEDRSASWMRWSLTAADGTVEHEIIMQQQEWPGIMTSPAPPPLLPHVFSIAWFDDDTRLAILTLEAKECNLGSEVGLRLWVLSGECGSVVATSPLHRNAVGEGIQKLQAIPGTNALLVESTTRTPDGTTHVISVLGPSGDVMLSVRGTKQEDDMEECSTITTASSGDVVVRFAEKQLRILVARDGSITEQPILSK